VRETLSYGQINLILCAIILYDVLDAKHPQRGIWIGIAGIKVTPLVFLGLLLVTRQWKALLRAGVAFAATVALGFLVAPRASLDYWTHLIFETSRIGGLAYAGNQSWNGFLIRISGGLVSSDRLWQVTVLTTTIGGFYLARPVCALIALLCSPVSWRHHWIWSILLGVALLGAVAPARAAVRRRSLVRNARHRSNLVASTP
jgi:alpha-1,2-mannosyltransferase